MSGDKEQVKVQRQRRRALAQTSLDSSCPGYVHDIHGHLFSSRGVGPNVCQASAI